MLLCNCLVHYLQTFSMFIVSSLYVILCWWFLLYFFYDLIQCPQMEKNYSIFCLQSGTVLIGIVYHQSHLKLLKILLRERENMVTEWRETRFQSLQMISVSIIIRMLILLSPSWTLVTFYPNFSASSHISVTRIFHCLLQLVELTK